ncbi:hypothetical protein Tco_1462506, partial [Tanacetum coccineum]
GKMLKYSKSSSSSSSSTSSLISYPNSPLSCFPIIYSNSGSPSKQEGSLVGGRRIMPKDSRSLSSYQTLLLMGEVGDSDGDDEFTFSIMKNGIVKWKLQNK